MSQLLVTLIAVSLLSACANVDTKAEPREEKEYVTGSNIPRKDRSSSGATVMSRETMENMQRSSGTLRGPDAPR